MLYFPRTAILAFECHHAFVGAQIEYRCHSFFLLPFESESTTELQGRQPDLDFALNGSSRSKNSNRSSRSNRLSRHAHCLLASISEILVDEIKERLGCDETFQVLDEDRQKRRPLFFGEAADSWANDNTGQAPELRIFRQGLARKRVQRRAGNPVFFQCSHQKPFLYRLTA